MCNPAFLDRPTYIATLRESRTAIQRIPKKQTQVKVFLNEFSENLFLYMFFLHFALSNLDIRSFQLNLEVTLVCYDAGVVADLRQIESAYIRKSSLVNIGEWKTRTVKEKLFENISRLTAALQ